MPYMDYENAAGRAKDYEWDCVDMRRNHGDPVHPTAQHLMGSWHRTTREGEWAMTTDYTNEHKMWFKGMIVFAFCFVLGDWYMKQRLGRGSIPIRCQLDTFENPWHKYNYGVYRRGGTHTSMHRFEGKCRGTEDDRMEDWGLRMAKNYTIKGWE